MYKFVININQLEITRPDGAIMTIDPADFTVGLRASGVIEIIQKAIYFTDAGERANPIVSGRLAYTEVDWANCVDQDGNAPTPHPTTNTEAVTYLNKHYFKRVQYSAMTL